MRKVFYALLILVLCSSYSFANVNPDPEVHKVIGGLYSLAAAATLNNKTEPDINNLISFFKDVPGDWRNEVKISRVNSSIWVGVNVNQYSTARHFLRDNAESLGIMESPEGYAWIGGDEAWIKACEVSNRKVKSSLRLKASKGSGEDSNIIFISTEGQTSWWQMNPTPKPSFANEIISKFGVNDDSEIHKPEGTKTNIYESVKPSDVIKKPANLHIGTRKNSFDMSMNMGDVIFTPVPQLRHDSTTIEEIGQ